VISGAVVSAPFPGAPPLDGPSPFPGPSAAPSLPPQPVSCAAINSGAHFVIQVILPFIAFHLLIDSKVRRVSRAEPMLELPSRCAAGAERA
jgi:hypothetical protein